MGGRRGGKGEGQRGRPSAGRPNRHLTAALPARASLPPWHRPPARLLHASCTPAMRLPSLSLRLTAGCPWPARTGSAPPCPPSQPAAARAEQERGWMASGRTASGRMAGPASAATRCSVWLPPPVPLQDQLDRWGPRWSDAAYALPPHCRAALAAASGHLSCPSAAAAPCPCSPQGEPWRSR